MSDNYRILIIDDEPSILEILKKALDEDGYRVDTINCGIEAFRMILHTDYALVITDIAMPGISGIDLLQKIKQVKPETDVLVMTAYTRHMNIQHAFKFKASGLLFKPFDLIQLKKKVHRILNLRKHVSIDDADGVEDAEISTDSPINFSK
jgi:DNA-binding NtrC family response regulator